MQVIEYLKKHSIDKLQEEFGIKVKTYDDVIVFNYCQIYSPKDHPITIECRGLILDVNYNIVSRSFDRFFNLGENQEFYTDFDYKNSVVLDKLDGSLIKIYYHKGQWHISTRGTAFAETPMPAQDSKFYDYIIDNIFGSEAVFHNITNSFNVNVTYIFEFTSPHNRVVTPYSEDRLTLISIRHNNSEGTYYTLEEMQQEYQSKMTHDKIGFIQIYDIHDGYQDFVESFTDCKEGIILWDTKSHKRIKIKNSLYVKLHHMKGDGLTHSKVINLVLNHETDEYLTYFPEDANFIMPYKDAFQKFQDDCHHIMHDLKDIPAGKEFAAAKLNTGQKSKAVILQRYFFL